MNRQHSFYVPGELNSEKSGGSIEGRAERDGNLCANGEHAVMRATEPFVANKLNSVSLHAGLQQDAM